MTHPAWMDAGAPWAGYTGGRPPPLPPAGRKQPDLGQTIVFSIEVDAERSFSHYRMEPIHSGDTVYKIVAKRLRSPEKVEEVRKLNNIASARTVLRHSDRKGTKYYASAKTRRRDWARTHNNRLRLPGTLSKAAMFEVYASLNGDAPTVVGGYAKLEVVDRPGRTGISHFTGYDPGSMEIPITFEAYRPLGPHRGASRAESGARTGDDVERDCQLLERMAGRGDFRGASTGPPSIIRVKALKSDGSVCPLIPHNWQWANDNEQAPVWRISNIEWDRNPIRDIAGARLRQHAVVTVQAYTRTHTVARSVVRRAQTKTTKGKTGGKATSGRRK